MGEKWNLLILIKYEEGKRKRKEENGKGNGGRKGGRKEGKGKRGNRKDLVVFM